MASAKTPELKYRSVFDVPPNDVDAAAEWYEAALIAGMLRPEDAMALLHMQESDDDEGELLDRMIEIVRRTGIQAPQPG